MTSTTLCLDKIFIRELELHMSAGIYDKERKEKQRVVISVTLDVSANKGLPLENIGEVVSYESIVKEIEHTAQKRHYDLLERFAEDIAENCFAIDTRIHSIDVSVEKPDIFRNVNGAGVRIFRTKK